MPRLAGQGGAWDADYYAQQRYLGLAVANILNAGHAICARGVRQLVADDIILPRVYWIMTTAYAAAGSQPLEYPIEFSRRGDDVQLLTLVRLDSAAGGIPSVGDVKIETLDLAGAHSVNTEIKNRMIWPFQYGGASWPVESRFAAPGPQGSTIIAIPVNPNIDEADVTTYRQTIRVYAKKTNAGSPNLRIRGVYAWEVPLEDL